MHPILISLGPFTIHTYGFMMAVGFLAAISVIRRLAEKDQLPVGSVLDLTFWALLVGFAGSRVLFVITQWKEQFAADPIAIFRVWEGGLVFLGGPIAVIPFVIWYVRKKRIPAWRTLDAMAPGLAVAHGFGRIGCLASGCCYGRPTGSNFGIELYSELVEESLRGIKLHPTQLYEALSLFALAGSLIVLRRVRKVDGQIVLTYFMSYSILRSVIETFRGDSVRGFLFGGALSTSQFLSALIFLACLVGMVILLKNQKPERPIS